MLKISAFRVALFAVSCLLLAGPLLADINLSPDTATYSAAGGSGSTTATGLGSSPWTVSSDQTWVKITSPPKGEGGGNTTITYSVEANPTGVTRTANVTVNSSSPLVITQTAGELSISPTSANANPAGDTGTIAVTTTVPSLQWNATSNSTWVAISSGASGIGSGSVKWTAAANTGSARAAVITVTPLGGVGQTFTISQAAGAPPPSISLSPSSINVDGAGGSGAIQVTASISSLTWTATSSNNDFAHLNTSSGTGSGAIQYTIRPNPTAVSRTATITVTPGQGAPAQTVTVTQSGGTLSISPASANVPTSGGSGTITLTTNDPALGWTAIATDSWVTITSGGQGTGPGQIQWTAASNTVTTSRATTISVTPAGGTAQRYSISQDGVITGTLSVNPGSVAAPASVSNGTVTVTSSNQALTWTASSSDSWLTISAGTAGTGNGSFHYAAIDNPTAATRTATITVTPSNGTVAVFTVTQAAAALTISPSAAKVSAAGDTGSLSITTTTPVLTWSTSSNASWLTISAALGTGGATLDWAAGANNTTTARLATISVTPQGGVAVIFTVIQAALSGTITAMPSTLSFSYQKFGTPPAAAQITVAASSAALPFTATTNGESWLTVSANSSATPGVLTISANPGSLAEGTYQGTVTITSGAATNSPVSIPVTFTVSPAPVLTSAPNALTFSYQQNGPIPASQTITIGASSGSIDYTIVPDSGAPWLSASGAGTAPATLTVSVNTAGLAPGMYQGNVTLIGTGAGNNPFVVPVTFTISAAPTITATPSSLAVTYRQLDPLPAPLNFQLTSSGTDVPFQASISSGTPWLKLTGIARFTNTGQTPASVLLAIDPTGLSPGMYQGAIVVTSESAGNNPVTVPITLTVVAAAALSATPSQVSFGWTQNVTTSAMQAIAVASDPGVTFTATVQTPSGGNWLSVLVSATGTPAVATISADGTGLAPGVYSGTVTLTSAQAGNSPLVIPVTLTVSAQPQLQVSPGSLSFSYQLFSGPPPPEQALTVSTPTQASSPVSVAVSTSSGGNWLTVSGGITTPGAIQVSVNATGLVSGKYSGTLTLTSPGYAPATVQVSFQVSAAPVLSGNPTSLDFIFQQGTTGLLPQSIGISSGSTAVPFSATAGSGTPWLSVTGGGTTPASVSVSINPAGLSPGTYSGTVWVTPAHAGISQLLIPVHLTVTAGIMVSALPGSLSFTYTQQQSAAPAVQALSISSSQPQNLSLSISPDESWLIVTGSGPAPASLNVSVDPDGLTPGRYAASIIVTAPGAANSPLIVPVSFTVNAAPTITPSQELFTFSYQTGGMAPANQTLTVTGTDSSLVVTAGVSTDSGGSWLAVTGGGNLPAVFSVTANTTGLSPGTYTGTVTLNASGAGNSPLDIPVTLVIASAPVITSAPSQLTFSYTIGGSAPAGDALQIASSGTALTYQLSATTNAGGPWLQVTSGGTTPGSTTVSVSPIGLAPGTYTGTVSITSSGAGNSPLLVPVTLDVGTTTVMVSSPASVQFVTQQGGSAPSAQTVHVDSGGTPIAVTYQVSPGANWLSYTGVPGTPADIAITVSPAELAPGRYTAVILVVSNFATNSPLEIPVALDVSAAPVLSASQSILRFTYSISGPKPAPQAFTVGSSGNPLQFTVSGGTLPVWLFASGSGTTPASVSVSVNPGSLTAGVYQSQVQLSSPDSNSPVSVQIILTVSNAPVLSAQPATLAFAYQVGGAKPTTAPLVISADQGTPAIVTAASTFSGANWLQVSGGGNTPAATSVSVNPVGLAPGTYLGQVSVTSADAGISPLVVPVTLTVSTAATMNASPGALAFAYQLGSSLAPSQQIVLTSSDGSPLPFTVVASFAGTRLTVAHDVSVTPAALTIGLSPLDLSPGVYQGSIVISSNTAGNTPLTIPVALTVSAAPSLTASIQNPMFAYGIGGPVPSPVSISLGSTDTALKFSASVAGGSPWVVIGGPGQTPAAFQIAVNPAGLTAGTYTDTVVITAPGAANSPLLIQVTLVVSGGSLLLSTPNSLFFTQTSVAPKASQTLQIGATGTGFFFTSSASPGTPWLSATHNGGTPDNVTVSVDATGLAPGTYGGAVQIYSQGVSNSPVTVPVTLLVTSTQSLHATPSPVVFSYTQAGPLPPAQTVGVMLGSQPTSNQHAGVAPGSPWLSAQSGSAGVIINVNPTMLLPGTYRGTVLVIADDASNSPLAIPVTLVVTGLPELDISQKSVAFTALVAQSQPVSTTISLTTGTNPAVNFDLDVTASTWLKVTPLSGVTPTTMTLTADPTGLRPGNYAGSIIVSSGGMRLQTIPVNLTIVNAPSLSGSPPFLVYNYSHGGNAPSPVNLYVGRFGADISVSATPSDPWISVNPSAPSTSGPIGIGVSPAGLTPGTYKGSITLTAQNTSITPPPSKQIPVTLYVDEPANPEIDSVLSGMSFLNSPLAPGLIFSIFGQGLGPSVPVNLVVQPDQTVSQSLGGVEVLVNGIPCPLLYVSSTQINAIAPYALYTKSAAHIAVRYLGVLSDEVPVQVQPSVPGLFTSPPIGAGPGAILNQDMTVNASANPAARGSMITLFGGGDGQSAPQGIDGLINPTQIDQLPRPLLPVTVTIGGAVATDVQYAGAAPTLTSGVIQVNVRIPATVPAGALPVILQIGALSQPGVTVNVK